jgi:polyprenyldihydroxybenzoate methyltransferase / 3-demethylubiquinol 3-O-methyltransferase
MFISHRTLSFSLRSLSTKTSVDPDELNRFRQLSSSWWNETGEYAALHSLNQLRVPFIREQLLQSMSQTKNMLKPLTNVRLLDIGCGGGILTEVYCLIIMIPFDVVICVHTMSSR